MKTGFQDFRPLKGFLTLKPLHICFDRNPHVLRTTPRTAPTRPLARPLGGPITAPRVPLRPGHLFSHLSFRPPAHASHTAPNGHAGTVVSCYAQGDTWLSGSVHDGKPCHGGSFCRRPAPALPLRAAPAGARSKHGSPLGLCPARSCLEIQSTSAGVRRGAMARSTDST